MNVLLKKWCLGVALSLSVSAAFPALAQTEKPDPVNYQVLETQAETKVVTEYFSFYCPHCFQQNDFFKRVRNQLPDGVKFERKHVSFMGGKMGIEVSKAYAYMVFIGREDELVPKFFNLIHIDRNQPKSVTDIRAFFVENGVDGDDFDSIFDSFTIDTLANEYDAALKRAGIRGVPAVVVNGQYHVTPNNIKSDDEYFELIDHLLEQN
ncbi:thiol:disulfide interchange protein DsbA/DsbL [Vibrio splendidus]